MVGIDAIPAFGRIFSPAVALLLELLRVAGLRSTKKRDGWTPFDLERFEAIGLTDKRVRYRAVRRLLAHDVIEVRQLYGLRFEYRLNPNWAKPKAEVVDLAAQRKKRRR
jgi:hypothetical protein